MATPSGIVESNIYFVNFKLPNKVIIQKVRVLEGIPSNCDALIGMDIIGFGDFAVSSGQDKTIFSFRLPSMTEIDFTKSSYLEPTRSEHKTGRNTPCPCGSGKKYKRCCGKDK
jgi:hypothetical protein